MCLALNPCEFVPVWMWMRVLGAVNVQCRGPLLLSLRLRPYVIVPSETQQSHANVILP